MIAARLRRQSRAAIPAGPDLAEPRTLKAFRVLLDRRNAAFSDDQSHIVGAEALAVLAVVDRGELGGREPASIRNFLGALGLISRFGRSDTITSAGLALLAAQRRA